MRFSSIIAAIVAVVGMVEAHTIITYPGWRGNNLITNETFPYGMQWMYPCGGMGTSRNRTTWPLKGGALALQPGWFQGHATAFMYINMGFGNDGPDNGPHNFSFPLIPVFQITGPSKGPYPGTICLPQVPLPANMTVKAGDLATIQVVEVAVHGASLFNCVDIIFAEPENVAEVTLENCFNTSESIGFNNVYTTGPTSGASLLALPITLLVSMLSVGMWFVS